MKILLYICKRKLPTKPYRYEKTTSFYNPDTDVSLSI